MLYQLLVVTLFASHTYQATSNKCRRSDRVLINTGNRLQAGSKISNCLNSIIFALQKIADQLVFRSKASEKCIDGSEDENMFMHGEEFLEHSFENKSTSSAKKLKGITMKILSLIGISIPIFLIFYFLLLFLTRASNDVIVVNTPQAIL